MTHDLLRFADPLEGIRQGFYTPPTISIRTALIPANSLSPALQDVLSVRFPDANVATGVTLDGLEFGIELANISQTLRAVWNTEGPDEWQLFITIVGRLREMLRQLFG